MEFREPPSRNLQCSNECLPVKDKLHHKGVPRINCDDFLDKWREQSWSVLKSLMSWRFETASQVNKFWLSRTPGRHEWLPSIPKHFLFNRDSHPAGWLEDLSSSLLWWDPWDTSQMGKSWLPLHWAGTKLDELSWVSNERSILGMSPCHMVFSGHQNGDLLQCIRILTFENPSSSTNHAVGGAFDAVQRKKPRGQNLLSHANDKKKTSLPIGGCPIRHHQKKSKLSKSSTSTINVDISCKPSESRWGPSIAKNNEANGCHKFQAALPGRYHWMMYVWT